MFYLIPIWPHPYLALMLNSWEMAILDQLSDSISMFLVADQLQPEKPKKEIKTEILINKMEINYVTDD